MQSYRQMVVCGDRQSRIAAALATKPQFRPVYPVPFVFAVDVAIDQRELLIAADFSEFIHLGKIKVAPFRVGSIIDPSSIPNCQTGTKLNPPSAEPLRIRQVHITRNCVLNQLETRRPSRTLRLRSSSGERPSRTHRPSVVISYALPFA